MIPFLLPLPDLVIMKTITLTQNKVAIVDDDDYEYLSQWKWYYNRSGYATRNESGHQILLHRLLIESGDDYVDHINRNKLDNRKCNLRICSNSQNQANSTKRSNNTSGYKGVSFNKQSKKWTAQITVNKNRIHLGYFDSPEDAAIEYDKYAREYFGEFALLNF